MSQCVNRKSGKYSYIYQNPCIKHNKTKVWYVKDTSQVGQFVITLNCDARIIDKLYNWTQFLILFENCRNAYKLKKKLFSGMI